MKWGVTIISINGQLLRMHPETYRKRNRILWLKSKGVTNKECAAKIGMSEVCLSKLLRRGLSKPTKCSRCPATTKLVNHHVSYVPEITIPLCRRCHTKEHNQGKPPYFSRSRVPRLFKIGNETHTLREWEAISGVPVKVLLWRAQAHYKGKDLIAKQGTVGRHLRMITVDGETKSMSVFAKQFGIQLRTLWYRLNAGIPHDVAVKTPVRAMAKQSL